MCSFHQSVSLWGPGVLQLQQAYVCQWSHTFFAVQVLARMVYVWVVYTWPGWLMLACPLTSSHSFPGAFNAQCGPMAPCV